jgi:hypothetical protein
VSRHSSDTDRCIDRSSGGTRGLTGICIPRSRCRVRATGSLVHPLGRRGPGTERRASDALRDEHPRCGAQRVFEASGRGGHRSAWSECATPAFGKKCGFGRDTPRSSCVTLGCLCTICVRVPIAHGPAERLFRDVEKRGRRCVEPRPRGAQGLRRLAPIARGGASIPSQPRAITRVYG